MASKNKRIRNIIATQEEWTNFVSVDDEIETQGNLADNQTLGTINDKDQNESNKELFELFEFLKRSLVQSCITQFF